MKAALGVTGAWIVGILVVLVIAFFSMDLAGVFSQHQQAVNARVAKDTVKNRVTQQVYDPQKAMADYEFFYQACNDAQGFQSKIKQAKNVLKEDEAQYKAELKAGTADPFGNLAAVPQNDRKDVQALENNLTSTINDYNARSSENTRAVFKAVDLPPTLSAGAPINCGNAKPAQEGATG